MADIARIRFAERVSGSGKSRYHRGFPRPAAAIGLMLLTTDNFKIVFWIAVIPAFIDSR